MLNDFDNFLDVGIAFNDGSYQLDLVSTPNVGADIHNELHQVKNEEGNATQEASAQDSQQESKD